MEKSILDSFRISQIEKKLCVYGVHVYKDGEESVSHRFRSDDFVNVYSSSKTFTAVGVGIAQDEGLLKVTDAVLPYFPEFKSAASEGSENITLRDLLHMASGKILDRITEEDEAAHDPAELFFSKPMLHKPGEYFYYSSLCTYMLGRVVEKVSGQLLRDYLVPRLFDKFGIFNPQWLTCYRGHTLAAIGLMLKTHQLARMGEMLLHKGVIDGKRVVSESYVNAMYEDVVPNEHRSNDPENGAGYGYQVWRNTVPGTYRTDGLYGQFSIVIPQKNAVVTTTSHNEGTFYDIVRAVFSDIVPRL